MIDIIPAIDLIDGKCVRLTQGDFTQKTIYSDDPLEIAKRFDGAGFRRLHMVDLDGAKSGTPKNLAVLERVATNSRMTIDFGGGIKSETDLNDVFSAGAAIANIGSLAIKEPDLFFSWIDSYGNDRILLGADARNGKVAINGWQTDTGTSVLDLLGDYAERGLSVAFVTDIGRDGAMIGPSVELYERIISEIPGLKLIASGGVTAIEDIAELERIGCSGLIVGKAIYEGRITLEELSKYAG